MAKEEGIVVSFKASPGKAEEWLAEFKKRAENAYATEPNTLAYGALVNNDDKDEILIFERYKSTADREAHSAKPEQAAMNQAMLEKKLSASRLFRARSEDFGPGFWPQGRKPNGGDDKGTFVMLVHTHCRKGEPKIFYEKWKQMCEYAKEKEPNTLAYQAMTVADDGKANKGCEAGVDFFVLEQYTTQKDLDDVHMKSKAIADFGKSLKGSGVSMETKFQKRYTFTGVGFLSRAGTGSKL